jgi:hypothetical protein
VEKGHWGAAVAEARGQFGNPEERRCPPLEPETRGLPNTMS